MVVGRRCAATLLYNHGKNQRDNVLTNDESHVKLILPETETLSEEGVFLVKNANDRMGFQSLSIKDD